MKKILKKEVIVAFIVGIILASSIAVYAYSYYASDVSYTKPGTETAISVETALNDLYSKSNKTPQQVTTITTYGGSYTFQNDGYITGTIKSSYNVAAAAIYFNTNDHDSLAGSVCTVPYNYNDALNVSIYVPKNTVVYTRNDYGTYNLTCYEFK